MSQSDCSGVSPLGHLGAASPGVLAVSRSGTLYKLAWRDGYVSALCPSTRPCSGWRGTCVAGRVGGYHMLCHTMGASCQRCPQEPAKCFLEHVTPYRCSCCPGGFSSAPRQHAQAGLLLSCGICAWPEERVPGRGEGLPCHMGTPEERDSLEECKMGAGWVRFISSEL